MRKEKDLFDRMKEEKDLFDILNAKIDELFGKSLGISDEEDEKCLGPMEEEHISDASARYEAKRKENKTE